MNIIRDIAQEKKPPHLTDDDIMNNIADMSMNPNQKPFPKSRSVHIAIIKTPYMFIKYLSMIYL